MVKRARVRERQDKENKMKFWNLTALIMTLAMVAAAPDSAHSQGSSGGPARTIDLTGPSLGDVYGPPGGQVNVYPGGSLLGNFAEDYPDSMFYRVHNLACRSGWYTAFSNLDLPAQQFYVIYLTIADPFQRMRVQTFNTGCSSGGGGGFAGNGSFSNLAYIGPHPFAIENALEGLFTADITIEIYLEGDDGVDAPVGGQLVLSGTDPAPN
jgi:hypothetical protein